MKIAPLYHALRRQPWASVTIVHTGQHYDLNMSDTFFHDLGLPEPHVNLGVGSGTHAQQTGNVMIHYERILLDRPPDLVIVVGDVNSTMAATLTAVKLGIKVAHLEAGLRSNDRTMPEEINRIVTDALADILWTPSADADKNLKREGVAPARIKMVGNIMIDSLELMKKHIQNQHTYEEYNLKPGGYGVVTLHRPANVDRTEFLQKACESLVRISRKVPIVFPVHPRTQKNLENSGLLDSLKQTTSILLLEPQSYVRFMNLIFNCRLVITDSGGIQEETTYLGIPCLTMRPNTERPVTITQGTNKLCALENLEQEVDEILRSPMPGRNIPEMWDGHTAARVVESIKDFFEINSSF